MTEEQNVQHAEEMPKGPKAVGGPNDLIYHYTTTKGFYGIIEDKALWASTISSVNDAVEVKYPIELISGVLDSEIEIRRTTISGSSPNDEQEIQTLTDFLDATLQFTHTPTDAFVCSFCAPEDRGDSLSQWRAYAGKHSGFSIGFSQFILNKLAYEKGFWFQNCIYDEKEQRTTISSLVSRLLAAAALTTEPKDILAIWKYHLGWYICIFKHPSFISENERRMFTVPGQSSQDAQDPNNNAEVREHFEPTKIKHRPGDSMIIPYYRFSLESEPSPIIHVRVGPSPSTDAALANAQDFCQRNKITANTKVELSTVTYPN